MTALVPVGQSVTPSDQLDRAIAACLTGCAPSTRRIYQAAIGRYVLWCACSEPCSDYTDSTARGEASVSGASLTRERVALWLDNERAKGSSAVAGNQALSAVKRLATEAASLGWLPWETAVQIGSLKSRKYAGVRSGRWLTLDQVRALLAAPDRSTLAGARDAAALSLLVGCGLRREEAVRLCVDQLVQYPDGWRLVNLLGKGCRVRTVHVPAWVVRDVQGWLAAAQVAEGRILRSVSAQVGKQAGVSLSASAVRDIVRWYGAVDGVGVPELAPHDLRRTHAKLAREGGASLETVQRSLGHASLTTTERYLGGMHAGDAGNYIDIDIDLGIEGGKSK